MANFAMRASLAVLLILLATYFGNGRHTSESSEPLISDGLDKASAQPSVLVMSLDAKKTVTCEPVYEFLPCTTTFWGLLFMILVYEILLSLAGHYVSSGSDLFFEMFGTGIFGASLFNILGTIPQVILIIVSGFSEDEESLAAKAEKGMGLLAGSTIMILTLIWGSALAFGSYDLQHSSTSSKVGRRKSFFMTEHGVATDNDTIYTARIMLASMTPFLILQLPKILNTSYGTRIIVLVSLLITVAFLFVYCTYQVFQPWIQDRRLEYLLIKYVQDNLLESLTNFDGRPNEPIIREVFHRMDWNNDARISAAELRALLLGMHIEEVGLDEDDFVGKVMEELDVSSDSHISETEFISGLSKWISALESSGNINYHHIFKFQGSDSKKSTAAERLVSKRRKRKGAGNTWFNYIKASFLVCLGTAIMIVLSPPLMGTIEEFSTAAKIPSFLVSYVVIPFALNFRLAMGAIQTARQRTEKATSLTFSEIYNAVFMNNMMGLMSFLLLVYLRDLPWDVSAEVLVVLVICTSMGLFTSFFTKFQLWTSLAAYLLYPLSLMLIYVLTFILGWS